MSNVKGPDEAQNPDFEELVAQYQGSVLRMCFLYLCDKTLAEDAVQETFVKVYRGLNSFHGQSSIKTWIMKIAIHTCYDMNHSGWFRHFDRRITPEMLPEAAVPFEERDEELITAVMRLPIKLREVILLFYYQGFSIQEIMDSLGVSQSAVTGRLKRGRDRHRAAETGKRQTSRITGKEGFRCVKLKKERSSRMLWIGVFPVCRRILSWLSGS